MSIEIKHNQALNLYGILDNELARMHTLMQTYLALPSHNPHQHGSYSSGGISSATGFSSSQMPVIYRRINEIQDMLMLAVKAHDPAIQVAIAELALTGISDPNK